MKLDVNISVKPVEKLIDVVEKGIGKLYQPIHTKRMAKAKAEEINIISDTISNSILPTQYNNGNVNIDNLDKRFIKETVKRFVYTEIKGQKNIDEIVEGAIENLENEEAVSNEPVQDEWINRFFNIAKEITSEDLKIIWSKILSEEIMKPGNCSIRTLEVLRSISLSEAQIFKKIVNYVVINGNSYFLPVDRTLFEIANIKFEELLRMEECSLIKLNSDLVFKLDNKIDDYENCFIYNGKKIFYELKSDEEVVFDVYPLTEAGKNIFNILTPIFDEEFYQEYKEILREKLNIVKEEDIIIK